MTLALWYVIDPEADEAGVVVLADSPGAATGLAIDEWVRTTTVGESLGIEKVLERLTPVYLMEAEGPGAVRLGFVAAPQAGTE